MNQKNPCNTSYLEEDSKCDALSLMLEKKNKKKNRKDVNSHQHTNVKISSNEKS